MIEFIRVELFLPILHQGECENNSKPSSTRTVGTTARGPNSPPPGPTARKVWAQESPGGQEAHRKSYKYLPDPTEERTDNLRKSCVCKRSFVNSHTFTNQTKMLE